MCLVVIAFRVDDRYPLIVGANRDEFHARPSKPASWWPDAPGTLGGRDLLAGGSWLAVHRRGRFATVTNFRDAEAKRAGLRSRGLLVSEFVQGDDTPLQYLASLRGVDYGGFNLLVADHTSLAYQSNRGGSTRELPPGLYGLSNATLDASWEKVERSKAKLGSLIAADAVNESSVLQLLGDRDKGPVSEVRGDHLPFATAHAITAPFIVMPEYGTRCSTVVLAGRDGTWSLLERRFDAVGNSSGESRFSFDAVDAE